MSYKTGKIIKRSGYWVPKLILSGYRSNGTNYFGFLNRISKKNETGFNGPEPDTKGLSKRIRLIHLFNLLDDKGF